MGEHLLWGGIDTIELVHKFGSPLYVIDADAIVRNWRNMYSSITSRYQDSVICYAYKANSHFAVCKMLSDLGAGAEVASGGELYIALKVGVPATRIVFDGPNKSASELAMAIESRVMINADSLTEIERIQNIATKLDTETRVGLRVNPNIAVQTHPHLSTGLRQHKFGVPIESAPDVCEVASRQSMIDFAGLHTHLGSHIQEVEPFRDACGRLLDLANLLRTRFGIEIRTLDLGGGISAPNTGSAETSFDEFAEAITNKLRSKIEDFDLGNITLVLEPGRQIVADSGVLLTEVGVVKRTPSVNWAIVDAGMNHLIRPALYGAYHKIAVANKMSSPVKEKYSVGGPCCESGDVLGEDRPFPRLEEGDLLAVFDVGAYGFTMSSNFNSYPRPCVVFVREGTPYVIRDRESYEDLVRLEKIPSFH
jgi:diaminopimelate decarboxylase